MMRPYRIEAAGPMPREMRLAEPEAALPEAMDAPQDDIRLADIAAAIRDLRSFLDPGYHQAMQIVEAYRHELSELSGLKVELETMKTAIESTKSEVATLQVSEQSGQGLRRASGELDAVVSDTENATNRILATTEGIETKVTLLREAVAEPPLAALAGSILGDVARLYEACNFQDLTGQRIAKIVKTLGFVEERIDRMIAAWGGLAAFESIIAAHAIEEPSNDDDPARLLNGPRLHDDDGHVSQDEIDALFD